MKKLLTSICILLLSCIYCAAEGNTRLYCVCNQEWWNADDAAIAIYAYSEGGVNNAEWPGERMTKTEVDGSYVWTAELTGYFTNVIFVRVNSSGTVEDWGAKTQDLTIPTDGRNLYTITSSEAVWGDPGVEGEWSTYDDSSIPNSNKDEGVNVYSVVGSATLFGAEWDVTSTETEMTPSPDSTLWTYTIPSVRLVAATKYEFKVVADHTWNNNTQYPHDSENYSFAVPSTGTYQITFTLTPTKGCVYEATLLEDEFPDFAYSKYAILVNHDRFVPCSLQPVENFVAQYLALVQLNEGDTIRLFTRGEESYEKSMPALEESGEYANFYVPSNNNGSLLRYYVCNVAGSYAIYYKRSHADNSLSNLTETESVWIGTSSTYHPGEDYASNLSAVTVYVSATDGHGSVTINAYGRYADNPYDIVPFGSTIEIEAFPTTGYMFIEWSDGSFQNKRRLIVTEALSLTATIDKIDNYPLGLLVNGNRFIRTAKSETTDYGYQNLIRAQLTEGETFVVFNSSTSETIDVEMEAGGLSGNFSIADQTNTFVCNVSGCYDVYVKKNNSTLSETMYIGEGTVCNDGVPWTDPNTGYVYSVVGTENLFGTAWDIADTLTNMTPVGDGRFEYTLDSVTLTPEGDYQYKVIANHMWNVREYPSFEEDDNYHITVEESGVYSVLFSLDTIAGCSATPTYLHAIIDNPCPIASGSCGASGDNLTWVLGCDSVLTISGEGEMPTSYSGTSAPWYQYGQTIKHINIEEGVTKLALYAFYNSDDNYPNVQTLSIPSTLGAPIENNFFYQCPLKTITINSDTIVGKASYSSGSSLQNKFGAQVEEYIFGGSVRSIANFAFYNQSPDSLRSIILPEGLEAIGNWAFGYIEHMTSISIPSMVQTIGTDAFAYCSNLRSVELGEGLMTVNGQAFWMCDSLTRVTCNALTPPTLNQTAFDHNQNDTLFIPCEAKTAYQEADYWKNFSKIMCADDTLQILASGTFGAQGNNLTWTVDRNYMLTISGSGEMEFFNASEPWAEYRYQLRKIVVEEGVTNLSNVFRLHNQVTEVSLPNTLRVIEAQAFDQCSSITHLELPESVDSIGEGVFYLCESLQEIRIPSRVTMINSSLFRGCRGLRSVEFPNGLTRILTTAFQYCNELNALHLPASLTFIGQEAFADCTGLDTIIVLATTPPEVTQSAFDNVPDTIPVFVPTASLRAYRNHEEWSYFKNIHGIDGDGPQTYTFTLTSAWQFIMLPTVFGLTQDDIVVDGEIEWGIYNSAQRASGRSGWQGFTPQNGFEGSQAYIVRARNGSATLTINIPDQAREQAAVTMAISYHPATREQNANWNFLGNPYPYNYDIMSALEEADIESPVTIWNGTGYDLFTPGIDLKTLDPFEAFFIQLPEGGSEVLPLSPEHIQDTSDSGNNGNSVADADGALPGYFTINTSKEKVRFSRGNLQYQASTATWQFAENQYDVIGEGNVNISATYDGWIDLFGWGTGDNPTKASTSKCDYSGFVDWGINAISNGGNTADMWRTLSADEWTYITGQRTNYESLCGRATVNGIQGFILLPDDWVSPGIPFQGSKDNGYELNQFSLEDWRKMEAAGAVFLPACGGRTGTEMTSTAVQYWSTNEGSSCYAYDIITNGDTAYRLKTNQVERSSAFGVRLVK